ncbi:MAG: RNA degradosome polyphosphate kinase, partial [Firmicutes bacterium]|nr:RNA degradosome polyphosphate kinase [Bacillota bacterium]
ASDFFRNLSLGTMEDFEYKKLLIAPVSFKEGLLKKVREQIALAEEGKEARIVAKMNSLTDLGFIKEFIRASNAGVKIDLIVRGICCIIPGLIGKTENITVKSIIGRFLEHSRIYAFGTENPEIYISSADLMTRNVTRRVEIATPILCNNVKKRVMHLLEVQLADKEKAWYLDSDGIYRKRNNESGKSSQQVCMDME